MSDRLRVTEVLLRELAETLGYLAMCGVRPQLGHGAVMTDVGYVLPDPDGGWMVRMKVGDGQQLVPRYHDDDLDD